MTSRTAPQRRRLGTLWALIAVFALPPVAAWFFYLNPEYLPTARSNRGELIHPPVDLPTGASLRSPDGLPFPADVLSGRWTLVVLSQSPCIDSCEGKLRDIRQVRLALGESSLSIERLLLSTGRGGPVGTELPEDLAGTRVALLEESAGRALDGELGAPDGDEPRIYILDPMGRLMMRYAPDAPAEDILKDMGRLLKGSKNWIKGAQYGHQ